jgi:hypothetical protein
VADRLQVVAGFNAQAVRKKTIRVCVPKSKAGDGWRFEKHARAVLDALGTERSTYRDLDRNATPWVHVVPELPRKRAKVAACLRDWFETAMETGRERIHLPWTDACKVGKDTLRFHTFEAIRAYGEWIRNSDRRSAPGLVIHLTDRGLLFDLRNGRIDVNQLLALDDIEFEVQIRPFRGARIVEPFIGNRDTQITDIASAVHLPKGGEWYVETDPPVTGMLTDTYRLDEIRDPRSRRPKSLAELGLPPGAMLRFLQGRERAAKKSAAKSKRSKKS